MVLVPAPSWPQWPPPASASAGPSSPGQLYKLGANSKEKAVHIIRHKGKKKNIKMLITIVSKIQNNYNLSTMSSMIYSTGNVFF